MEYNCYTYQELEEGVNILARQMVLDNWKPEHVVGVLRGGIMPAVHLSHWFDCNISAISWSTRDGKVIGNDGINIIVKLLSASKNVLLVDDICDTGLTLDQIVCDIGDQLPKKKQKNISSNLKVACLHYNVGQDLYDPDYYQVEINKDDDPRWIWYPWEK